MKNDIQNWQDIRSIISLFYKKLLADPKLSYLFTEVAKIDLEPHLDLIADFWDGLIFNATKYKNNPMKPHIELNAQSALNKEHFERWLMHFQKSVDTLFYGEKAQFAKNRAASISMIMQSKILFNSAL